MPYLLNILYLSEYEKQCCGDVRKRAMNVFHVIAMKITQVERQFEYCESVLLVYLERKFGYRLILL